MAWVSPHTVNRRPFLWEPDKALSFPEIYSLICECHPATHPVSREIIACIFFEETAFCNRKQKPGPGVGFGQIQVRRTNGKIFDPEKAPFFESLGYSSDQNGLKTLEETILGNKRFSVEITCKFFQWLVSLGKSTQGALLGQTGGGKNATYVPLFIEGGRLLTKAMTQDWNRPAFVDALSYAPRIGFHHNAIPLTGNFAHTKFWEYVIPEDYLKFGY
jgi:hypothetical protein